MTTLYLSGPMTGLPELNFPAFHSAAAALRAAGYTVVNPAELHQTEPGNWLACMWTDLAAMAAARPDGIAYLPGWPHSQGARTEVQLIWNLRLDAWDVPTWLAMAAQTHPANPHTHHAAP